MKNFLIHTRDAFAFTFSWLVLCVMALAAFHGGQSISLRFLGKLIILSFWAASCFSFCFQSRTMQKKGFIFSLSVFYLSFLPIEVLIFYWMGLWTGIGNLWKWFTFLAIIIAMYLVSLLIDCIAMRKRAVEYTDRLREFQENR